jgi:energy-converting hydrogenase Eha subunit E
MRYGADNPGMEVHNKELGTLGAALRIIVRRNDRSWLTLLAFFAVTTLASSLVLAALFAGVTVAIAGGEAPQVSAGPQVDPTIPSQTFSGVITDARCGSRHRNSNQSPPECARACVREGSRYTVVDGDKNYELAGNLSHLDSFAGQRVALTGVLDGNTIKVSSASLQVSGGHQ